jgi:hypothetical protein
MKYCFHCKKKLEEVGFMYGLDRPYINLFFHLSCIAKIKEDHGSLYDYVVENYEEIKLQSQTGDSKKSKSRSKE